MLAVVITDPSNHGLTIPSN